jgi:DEAD/DEAH box helicase domain-containing protein
VLPSVVADELRDAVRAFLRSAFPIATRFFRQAGDGEGPAHACRLIDDLVDRSEALFKGPYLDLKLPFRRVERGELPFRHLTLPFDPYRHQQRAFLRLAGDTPRSTIIATGTGSGKTECFMLPVLDDCLNRRERGIKTLVIYPMNALATDQARRFAEEVAKLDTKLTVGLYVGGEQSDASDAMGPDHVITDQETLREHPPDILLTNYKMLDFLLIRPKDQRLWRFNKPGMLRYLVVDELHTFDGAQGTDLACLIRRLRDRLGAGQELACVGTSATMGTGSQDVLLTYASEVFATSFDGEAVIGEDRLSVDEFLPAQDTVTGFHWPRGQWDDLDPVHYRSAGEYLFHQARLWFAEQRASELPALQASDPRSCAEATVKLGELLLQHVAFHALLRDLVTLTDTRALVERWREQLHVDSSHQARLLLTSLLSLAAAARVWNSKDDKDPAKWCKPLVQLGVQLWLRELRRMVCSVPTGREMPQLVFADDLKDPLKPLHLPLVHCRECHLAAWGALARDGDVHLDGDLQHFYQAWFQKQPQARVLVPVADGEHDVPEADQVRGFCPHCMRLQPWQGSKPCCECERPGVLPVRVPDMQRETTRQGQARVESHHDCPGCGARDGLMVVGYRAATLTSVMVGRLFATPYNDHHKLIAFSDSVQDAAHRAGFLGANTWRQSVRQAMTMWLKAQARPLSLEDMSELLPHWWRQQIGDEARFCGLFIPPNLLWRRDYEHLRQRGHLPAGSDLAVDVGKRLSWECMAEFGRRSRIGRSLERTGQAAVSFDADRLMHDVAGTLTRLREDIEALRAVPDADFRRFLVGLVHHLRQTGAVHSSVLDGYLTNKGKEFLLNRIPWMPGFGRGKRPPSAVTLGHLAPNFEALVLGNRDTWAVRWLKKTLAHDQVMVAAESWQIFKRLLDELARTGWLVEKSAAGEPVYQLSPSRLAISAASHHGVCDHCQQIVYFGADMDADHVGMPCSRGHCRGQLAPAVATPCERDFGQEQPHRLVPSEHTGLLERDEREAIEHSFIDGGEPWDINLLSATPTLEMGIDIGALSSVFLCSVPPAQANYLQRIGRAGRRDGNALAVTVANGRNHDLYFYADPAEMIAGAVHTPGVFLHARAVLERQLVAYCFGAWAATGVDASVLPAQMRKVLNTIEQEKTDHFPYNFLHYVGVHQGDLLTGFFGLFGDLDTDASRYLEAVVHGARDDSAKAASQPLNVRIVNRLRELVEERKELNRKVRKLKGEYERLEKLPADEATKADMDAVRRERGALQGLLATLNEQPVLNFFTDEGLLPNYAFPEQGVTLQTVILRRHARKQDDQGERSYDKLSCSFQRPARAALSELAPENRFYAISHELPIERVDMQLSRVEQWRFCDRCQHSERVDLGDRHSACPRCGSPQWSDSGQKHAVLRLRQVYATVDDRDSRIGDDVEQRQPMFFNRQMLVDVPPEGQAGGFRLKTETLPFGFEFVRRAVFREVNFGLAGGDGNRFAVAGRELPRRGFRICRHCGTVQKERPRRNEYQHAWTCHLRQHPEQEKEDDLFDSLYLYRDLESEAIRILLPLSEVAYSDEKLHSFIAALHLGLKKYFHGDVHHLEVTDMREPASQSGAEKVFLVIYDTIPGGTGYLKELMRDPDNLMRVLDLARRQLVTCECVDDEDRDGCYRCILAYRDSRNMPTISRQGAAELLGEILALRDELEPIASLQSITTNVLIESELEQRFVDALAALPHARMSQQVIHGKTGSLLTFKASDGERPTAWFVEHQVRVGPAEQVALNTEIDVLLTPARAEDAARYRPIAVYLDGLQYHHDRVGDDVRKRMALLLSRGYWVFSLNWDDLPSVGKQAKPLEADLLARPGTMQDLMRKLYEGMAGACGWPNGSDGQAVLHKGSMANLESLLRYPARMLCEVPCAALLRGLTALVPQLAKDAQQRASYLEELSQMASAAAFDRTDIESGQSLLGGFMQMLGNAPDRLSLASTLPMTASQQGDGESIRQELRVHVCFDDHETTPDEGFKVAWRAFWHAANVLQFLPGFSMATRTAVSDGSLASTWEHACALAGDVDDVDADAAPSTPWHEVFELTTLPRKDIEALQALSIPVPEVGLDIAGADGAIVLGGDVVELGWPDARVAVLNRAADADVAGWKLVVAEGSWLDDMASCKNEGRF